MGKLCCDAVNLPLHWVILKPQSDYNKTQTTRKYFQSASNNYVLAERCAIAVPAATNQIQRDVML